MVIFSFKEWERYTCLHYPSFKSNILHPPSSWIIPPSSCTSFCHPERSEGSPYSVWGVVSGRKEVKKRPVTTWNRSISILSCCVRAENSIKRPDHDMEKWKNRWHTAIVTLLTDSSLRSEWQNKDASAALRMTKSRCLYCHPERSEGSPHSVWGVVSG